MIYNLLSNAKLNFLIPIVLITLITRQFSSVTTRGVTGTTLAKGVPLPTLGVPSYLPQQQWGSLPTLGTLFIPQGGALTNLRGYLPTSGAPTTPYLPQGSPTYLEEGLPTSGAPLWTEFQSENISFPHIPCAGELRTLSSSNDLC